MGSIWGFHGEGDTDLIGAMQRPMGKRAEVKEFRVAAGSWGLAAGSTQENSKRGCPGIHVSDCEAIRCVFDGYLINREEVDGILMTLGSDPTPREDAARVAELYRHRGTDSFAMLDGAFALAVQQGDTLVIARDALGEKPLYFAPDIPGTFLFASEVKSFLGHPGFDCSPSLHSLYQLMVFSFVPGKGTAFTHAQEVPPAHFLVKQGSRAPVLHEYWKIEERIDRAASEEEHVERIRSAFVDAVKYRLPDGPEGRVGALLSGGVDSSAVVAILDELGVDFETWSLGFGPEHLSELHYAQMVAEHRKVPMNIVEVGPSVFVEHLEEVVWHLDDPLCDCITVPNFILAATAGRNVDVLYNGEGGDPLFGGPKNKFMILGEWYRFLGGYDRVKSYLGSYHKAYDHLEELFTPAFLSEVEGPQSLEDTVVPYLNDPAMTEFLNRMFHINIKLKGGHNILIKVDKMFSANGVQPRSPLFDKRLTEASFTVPCEFKRRGDVEKYVLKKAVESMLPEHVVYRRKAGMGVPLNHWFRTGDLREHSMDMLSRERLIDRGYFQPDFVEALFTGSLPHRTFGRNRTGEILWMLLAVEQWHRLFVDGGWRKRMEATP